MLGIRLSSDAVDVSGRQFMLGVVEDLFARALLDQLTRPMLNPKEGDVISDPSSLRQVVGDDHDRIAPP